MKTGMKTVQAFSKELARQNDSKRDFIVNTHGAKARIVPIEFDAGGYSLTFKAPGHLRKLGDVEYDFPLNRYALGQIANHAKIPMQVVDLLMNGSVRERIELGNLLSVRLQDNPAARMIRTMDIDGVQTARAFLSDSYRIIDNWDLAANAIMPVLNQLEDVKIESMAITDEKMYVKVVIDDGGYEIGHYRERGKKVGDIVQAGISISNSEVGNGRFSVEPLIFVLRCLNGMIINDAAMYKNHVGRKHQMEDGFNPEAFEVFSDETRALDDAAFFSKVKDTIRATVADEDKFMNIVQRFLAAKDEPITGQAQPAVRELGRRFQLTETDEAGIMQHLIEGGELSRFGMIQAVTAYGRDDSGRMTYNQATDFERLGGTILELPKSDWRAIAESTLEEKKTRRKK